MDKLDLTKADKTYYGAVKTPQLIELGAISYLTCTGRGEPGGEVFSQAVEALYKVGYAIKAICKKEARDFTVAKLEGLWWFDSDLPAASFPRVEWNWKLLIRQPDFVTSGNVEQARSQVVSRLSSAGQVSYEALSEGSCVQMLHIGPYSEEPASIARIHAFMTEQELRQNGLHHEIYLSDSRRTDSSVLKTILRLPVTDVRQNHK
ncbi:GyrI-like domain-containing protein [Paenibacillus sepulcri]|uniref:GyrI-like domain-containing protein n=2 Tax=Paenibacillus sepulcri TaxID=359917 RepID=A0ABS7C4N0_9BACL|nr:GyrI-like domain-containing protein [Paenibacillus sepulcri]